MAERNGGTVARILAVGKNKGSKMAAWYWEKVSVKSGEPISVTQLGPLSSEEIVAAV
ncbi:MAG: hypothetical protein IJ387_14515 [Thermoguttaceae bacterium]|nr:hypothetical protein [Thermoguttaceae bacterium]